MSNHAPGPWKLTYCAPIEEWFVDFENRFASVNGEMVESEARLIAAAPEMLDALQLIATYPEEVDPVAVAEKVIAKAKGETE